MYWGSQRSSVNRPNKNIISHRTKVVWTSNENLVWTELSCGQEIERVAGKLDLQQSVSERDVLLWKLSRESWGSENMALTTRGLRVRGEGVDFHITTENMKNDRGFSPLFSDAIWFTVTENIYFCCTMRTIYSTIYSDKHSDATLIGNEKYFTVWDLRKT